MKILTLYQPYATLIAVGAKTIETRSWGTSYRGQLLIHAAKKWDDDVAEECLWASEELQRRHWPVAEGSLLAWQDTLGCVVARADLVGCERCYGDNLFNRAPWSELDHLFGDLSEGRYGFRLADIRAIAPPIPWRGQRGLQDAPPELVAKVLAKSSTFAQKEG